MQPFARLPGQYDDLVRNYQLVGSEENALELLDAFRIEGYAIPSEQIGRLLLSVLYIETDTKSFAKRLEIHRKAQRSLRLLQNLIGDRERDGLAILLLRWQDSNRDGHMFRGSARGSTNQDLSRRRSDRRGTTITKYQRDRPFDADILGLDEDSKNSAREVSDEDDLSFDEANAEEDDQASPCARPEWRNSTSLWQFVHSSLSTTLGDDSIPDQSQRIYLCLSLLQETTSAFLRDVVIGTKGKHFIESLPSTLDNRRDPELLIRLIELLLTSAINEMQSTASVAITDAVLLMGLLLECGKARGDGEMAYDLERLRSRLSGIMLKASPSIFLLFLKTCRRTEDPSCYDPLYRRLLSDLQSRSYRGKKAASRKVGSKTPSSDTPVTGTPRLLRMDVISLLPADDNDSPSDSSAEPSWWQSIFELHHHVIQDNYVLNRAILSMAIGIEMVYIQLEKQENPLSNEGPDKNLFDLTFQLPRMNQQVTEIASTLRDTTQSALVKELINSAEIVLGRLDELKEALNRLFSRFPIILDG